MRVRIETLGCRVNRYDSALLAGELAARGYDIVPEGSAFEVYVLNSCTVTRAADAEARKLLRRARRQAPSARLVVTGCYAEVAPAEMSALPVDLVVPNRDKEQLARQVEQLMALEPQPVREAPFPDGGNSTRFFFKIQEGCDVRCSFCIIPDARGSARSLAPDRIIECVRRAGQRGFREVVLAGIHLGAYGRDLRNGPSLAELVRLVLGETSMERIRLGSLEPWGVRGDLCALIGEEPRFLPMLHLPLQSGSERILRAMRRPITAASYLRIVDSLFSACPELALYLDVIVGFPGERDEEFEETYRFLERFPWTKLHVFPYSARPGTPAADLPDQVGQEAKRARVARLIEWSDAQFQARMAARVGQVCEVLCEQDGRGHTPDHFPCEVSGGRPGEIMRVKLTGVTEGGAQLRGIAFQSPANANERR